MEWAAKGRAGRSQCCLDGRYTGRSGRARHRPRKREGRSVLLARGCLLGTRIRHRGCPRTDPPCLRGSSPRARLRSPLRPQPGLRAGTGKGWHEMRRSAEAGLQEVGPLRGHGAVWDSGRGMAPDDAFDPRVRTSAIPTAASRRRSEVEDIRVGAHSLIPEGLCLELAGIGLRDHRRRTFGGESGTLPGLQQAHHQGSQYLHMHRCGPSLAWHSTPRYRYGTYDPSPGGVFQDLSGLFHAPTGYQHVPWTGGQEVGDVEAGGALNQRRNVSILQ